MVGAGDRVLEVGVGVFVVVVDGGDEGRKAVGGKTGRVCSKGKIVL